ncbi:MAG: four-carbon acid sugar kinase family protein [Terracidiphilus sp.]
MTAPAQTGPLHGRLYAWYGDDFTGSTDVLEALALYGVKAVLFTRTPDRRALAAFSDCPAIGIAGESRSRNPQWMDRNLPAVFAAMRALGARVNHYKVCSTFDSSPGVGSIGRAMELGRAAFGAEFVPVVVGAPHLGRAVVFGNLFAAADGAVYRIDRHPAMRRHPVTPMTEADLRLHLARQTTLRMGLVDWTAFQADAAGSRLQTELEAGAEAVVFDGFDDATLDETARLICERAIARPVFAVGSSGLTHGLLRHWRKSARIGAEPTLERPAALARPSAVDRLLVLSGSCSPATAAQIGRAQQLGFAALHLEGGGPWREQAANARAALRSGVSVVLYTALGPQAMDQEHGEAFGAALGRLLRELALETSVRRVLIAGGDTATHAVKQLGLDALTFAAPLVPGVPLCRAHAAGSALDGLELALKGGQIGPEDFFAQVRDGG